MGHGNSVLQISGHRTEIDDAGLLVWDLRENRVYGDRTVASLYGLNPEKIGIGLPMEDYLARVHAEDRPALVKAMSTTILEEHQQHEIYRVHSRAGAYQYVVGFGRTFRDRDGTPVLYSGLVVPACMSSD